VFVFADMSLLYALIKSMCSIMRVRVGEELL
jgi:hypothetical protein